MEQHQIIKYAPYFYLTNHFYDNKNYYKFYLIVPIDNGEKVKFSKPVEFDSSYVIDGCVEASEGACEKFVVESFTFTHPEGADFDPTDFTIVVSIEKEAIIDGEKKHIIHKTIAHYDDADELNHPNPEFNGVANNRPYAYMTSPLDDSDEQCFPRMLVPLKGYRFSENHQFLVTTAGNNGVCEALLVLTKADDESFGIFAPKFINQARFRDLGSKEGSNFSAITYRVDEGKIADQFVTMSMIERNYHIYLATEKKDDTKAKSEVKVRTRSADTAPVRTALYD